MEDGPFENYASEGDEENNGSNFIVSRKHKDELMFVVLVAQVEKGIALSIVSGKIKDLVDSVELDMELSFFLRNFIALKKGLMSHGKISKEKM